MSLVTHNIMNNSICTLFDNILIDIHKFKSLHCIRKVATAKSIVTSVKFIVTLAKSIVMSVKWMFVSVMLNTVCVLLVMACR